MSLTIPVDYCNPNPCKNSGVCVVEEGKGYSCACHPGFTGFHCQGKKLWNARKGPNTRYNIFWNVHKVAWGVTDAICRKSRTRLYFYSCCAQRYKKSCTVCLGLKIKLVQIREDLSLYEWLLRRRLPL